jgi:hypothetical protein
MDDISTAPGWTEHRDRYEHKVTGVCVTSNGPMGRWGAYKAVQRGGKTRRSWLLKAHFKTPEAVVERLEKRGLLKG